MRGWCDWNSRSSGEYLDALLRLSPEERRKDRGASWQSIQDIFLHVIEDDVWWFENMPQGRLAEFESLVGRDLGNRELRLLTWRVDRSVSTMMDSLKLSNLRPLRASSLL